MTTHKHHDHAGGNAELADILRGDGDDGCEIKVYGHERDACHGATKRLERVCTVSAFASIQSGDT